MLTGTGAAGAYHAGVLRALHEAGIKIDVVAGRGIGAGGAMLSAIEGAQHLWDAARGWPAAADARFYRWRWTLRAAAIALGAALGSLLLPLAVLVGAVAAFPVGFVLQMTGLEWGGAVASGYARLVEMVFRPSALPLHLPRFVTLALLALLVTLAAGAVAEEVRARVRRRSRGALWWQLLGAPLDTSRITAWFTDRLWQVLRGVASGAKPGAASLSARYAQLLAENVGQPGFRELILIVHDLDGRRDLAAALLAEPYRRPFFLRRLGADDGDRRLEAIDLAASARRHAVDLLAAALSVPVAADPRLLRFPAESVWEGETHRLCDRPEATARLLEEVAHAGAEQVVLVSAAAEPAGPHSLRAGPRDARGRSGEYLSAVEIASIRDALAFRSGLFQAVFQIRPTHNPLGPFDFQGCYDERSDRGHTLAELVERGYEDARQQFVDSVVGASGEWFDAGRGARPAGAAPGRRATSSDAV